MTYSYIEVNGEEYNCANNDCANYSGVTISGLYCNARWIMRRKKILESGVGCLRLNFGGGF